MLDEVEIFNRALTQLEIQSIVNPGSAGKCKQPDLAITKKAANTPWTVGGMGSFTLLVENLAPGAAVPAGTVITVTENLPAGLTLAVPPPSGVGWTCTPLSGVGPLVVTCQYTVPPVGLPAGGSLPLITFTVNVTAASAAGSFLNCASVQGQLVGGAILQEPTNNNKSCITIPTGSISPVVLQIPVVLDAAGVSPAHYTSDLVAVHRSGAPTLLTVTYYAAPNTSGGVCTVSPSPLLLPGKEWRQPDVLAFLRVNGCSSILPSGPLEAGTLQLTFQGVSDPSLVFAGSRATTPNPSTTVGGRFGLFLTGIPVGSAPSQSATIFALREDTAYRSNLAIVDFPGSGTGAPALNLQVMDGATGLASGFPIPYALGPGEWHQFGSILGSVTNGYVTITKTSLPTTDRFLAYGVVNDGPASGGGTADGSLVGTDGAEGLVPIVMSVTSSGFFYTSELVLTNTNATSATATLTYTSAVTLGGSGVPYTTYVSIGPGRQIRVPDTITWLRDTLFMPLPPSTVNQGGTLLVSGAKAYVRTSNPNPDTFVGGTFGLAYPAVPYLGRAWTEAWVYGLVRDSATRTNLAIADARVSDPTTAVTYLLDIYDADTGSPNPVLTLTRSLKGGQWNQVDGILSLPAPAIAHGYVRVRPQSGPSDYVVYGVLNDGAAPGPPGTSDGSYVPMSGVQ